MARKLKVAVAQTNSLPTVRQTITALESIAHDAAVAGVGLVLFPEAYLGGYPRTCYFGSAIGMREEHGREQFLRYFDDAVDLGDTTAGAGELWAKKALPIPKGAEFRGDGTREALERIANETGVFLAVGIIEKAGTSLYCSVVLVDPSDGMLSAKRRKVMPTGTERLIWAQGDASTLKAVRVKIKGVPVTLGSAICWENFMPLLRYSLYAQSVNIWLAPTADGRDTWLPLIRTIASEGRTFVLSCNQVVRQSELPDWVRQTSASGDTRQKTPSVLRRSKARLSVSHTQEGHEICWPVQPAIEEDKVSGGTISPRRRRKSSIFKTTNGHEIFVVEREAEETKQEQRPASQQSGVAFQSVFSEDGESVSGSNDEQDPYVSRGGSCIVSPMGNALAGPQWENKGLIISEIDIDDCVRGKLDFDVAGHYSRSDSFKLTVEGLDLTSL